MPLLIVPGDCRLKFLLLVIGQFQFRSNPLGLDPRHATPLELVHLQGTELLGRNELCQVSLGRLPKDCHGGCPFGFDLGPLGVVVLGRLEPIIERLILFVPPAAELVAEFADRFGLLVGELQLRGNVAVPGQVHQTVPTATTAAASLSLRGVRIGPGDGQDQ